ncbi:hypothetical protein GCM10020220_094420 [Nonomuraea rubra]
MRKPTLAPAVQRSSRPAASPLTPATGQAQHYSSLPVAGCTEFVLGVAATQRQSGPGTEGTINYRDAPVNRGADGMLASGCGAEAPGVGRTATLLGAEHGAIPRWDTALQLS